jgi:uncharacterized protein YoaH (UPF0181 family)
MKTYKIKNRETDEIMESGLSLIEATEIVNSYVREDENDDRYIPDLYQIIPEK